MIIVTAPTSNIGSQVIDHLLDAGESLRLIARDPSKLPTRVIEAAEVVQGSHTDAAVLDRAFDGADHPAVFWLLPADVTAPSVEAAYVDASRPAAAAFEQYRPERVVGISALGRGTPQAAHAGYVTGSLAMDDLIAATGVPYRAIVLPSFMDNVARQVASIRDDGVYALPASGDRALPTTATRDTAAVAARLLTGEAWTGFAEVPVLGPEDLSAKDQARIIGEVLGKEVTFVQTPIDDVRAGMIARGLSEPMAQAWVDMMVAKGEGLDEGVARTAETASPTTFRQWCEDVLRPAVGA